MAVYTVASPNGTKYRIEGPDDATDADLIRQVKRFELEEAAKTAREKAAAAKAALYAPSAAPETTFGGSTKEFFKGIVPGAVGLGETAATGLAALLPEKQEQAVREAVSSAAAPVKEYFKPAAGYEESVGRKLGEAVGSTIPFFGLGALGLAGRVAAGGAGIAAGAGEARQAAEAKGATPEERSTATLLGAPTGLLDIIAPEAKAVKTFLSKEIGPLSSMMLTAVKRGGYEGATEAAQKISQNLIAKGVYDPEQPLLAGSGEEGAYGAGAGALTSLIIDMTLGRKARLAQFPDKPAAAPPTPEKPAPEQKPFPTVTGQLELPLEGGRTAEELAVDQTRVPRAPTRNQPQGDLFPVELEEARTKAGLPSLVQEPPKPPTYGGQEELPFEGGRTAEELAVDRQRIPREPTKEQPQGDMFPVELREAREAAGLSGLLPSEAELAPARRKVTEADQMELPLEGGQTAEDIAAIKKAEADREPFIPGAKGAQGVLFPEEANAIRALEGRPPLQRPAPPPPPPLRLLGNKNYSLRTNRPRVINSPPYQQQIHPKLTMFYVN